VTESEAAAALQRLRGILGRHGLSAIARQVDAELDEIAARDARDVSTQEHLARLLDALTATLGLAESLRRVTPHLLTTGTDATRVTIGIPDVDDVRTEVPAAWRPVDITERAEAELPALERLLAMIRELQTAASSDIE
jgi:hypothetical protein